MTYYYVVAAAADAAAQGCIQELLVGDDGVWMQISQYG